MSLFGSVYLTGVPTGPALPGGAALAEHLVAHGWARAESAGAADLVVLGPEAEAVELAPGVGVVVLLDGGEPGRAAVEQMAAAGIAAQTVPARQEEMVVPEGSEVDLLAWVDPGPVDVHATLTGGVAAVRARGGLAAPGAAVVALAESGRRTAVVGIDTLATRSAAAHALVRNAAAWAARRSARPAAQAVASGLSAEAGTRPAVASEPAWLGLKDAVSALRELQGADGAVTRDREVAAGLVGTIRERVGELAPHFPHDAAYLEALDKDFQRWLEGGLEVPDFYDSLVAFRPETQRVDGRRHLVVFPMYTQNGSRDRKVEAVLVEVIWPDFVARLESHGYSNTMFVPIRFVDFTAGYDTNSAVLFPETVAMREIPVFTWGAIFADREAARFRRVVAAAAATTRLALPPDAQRLLADQHLAEHTFVMWDLIHDRTHMRGDLPFDPFMIKQRMPYFLYSLEELRCDLTAFREAVALEEQGEPHARLVQYAVLFDRIFRFPITGPRVRNYDGLGGQLLFAWLHQHRVVHWTDNRLTIDWPAVPAVVIALGGAIEELYWRSIDRPKIAHWLAAYELVSSVLTPHPASVWAKGPDALPVTGPLKEMTDAVLDDEFPLSMFHEALSRKLAEVVVSTAGITGAS